MDTSKLKRMAAAVRRLLRKSGHPIGYNQSLDLIASMVGLRNWPEVQAFPERVAASPFSAEAGTRLANRITEKFGLTLPTKVLLDTLIVAYLSPLPGIRVWPDGPPAGVYFTTTRESIEKVVARYGKESKGAELYAHYDEALEDAVKFDPVAAVQARSVGEAHPVRFSAVRGGLFVVGPMQLSQADWDWAGHLTACLCFLAKTYRFRIVVLIDAPAFEYFFEDIDLAVRSQLEEPETAEDLVGWLRGTVNVHGDFEIRDPFVQPAPLPIPDLRKPSERERQRALAVLPAAVRKHLKAALDERPSGILVFGSPIKEAPHAVELINAALVLTEDAGSAARVRSSYLDEEFEEGDDDESARLPEPMELIPALVSVQSARAHQYRRVVFDASFTDMAHLLPCDGMLFMTGVMGIKTNELLLACQAPYEQLNTLLENVIALVSVATVTGESGTFTVSDVCIPRGKFPVMVDDDDLIEALDPHRRLKWEHQVRRLLRDGKVSEADVYRDLGVVNLD